VSIWGKLLGGAAGFALGGPIGALIGAIAGHAYDKTKEGGAGLSSAARQSAFAIGVVVLAAKMAKADGRVTRDEVAAFKRIFRVSGHEAAAVGRIFNEAKREATGFEPYAAQIATLFRATPGVLEELLDALFVIALADGELHPGELDYLQRVAAIFGFSQDQFESIRARHKVAEDADPYRILGVPRDISDAELKKTYHKLVREHHPDRLIAQGLPQEFVEVATEKLAAINDAYDRIAKARGLN